LTQTYPLVALLVAGTWMFVVALGYRRSVSRPWWPALLIVATGMVCWNVGYCLEQTVLDSSVAYVASFLIEASALMVTAGAVHFAASLTRVPTGWRAVVACVGYVVAAGLFLTGRIPSIGVFLAGRGPDWDRVVVIYEAAACIVVFALQGVELARAKMPLDRHRIKYVMLATVVTVAAYINDFDFMTGLPNWSLGNVTSVFCGAIVVRAMVGDRLVPVSTVFRNTRHMLAAVVLIAAGYIALLTVGPEVLRLWLVLVPVAVVVTLYMLFLVRNKVFDTVERLLFSERYRFRRELEAFETRIATMDSPRDMATKLLELFTDRLGIEHALLIASEEIEPLFIGIENQSFRGTVAGEHVYALREMRLLKILSRAGGPVRRQDILSESWGREIGIPFNTRAMEKTMDRMHCELFLPLTAGNRLLGALGLGEKASGDVYNNEDIRVLRELAVHIGLYLENARIHYRAQQADRMASLRQMADRLVERLRERVERLRDTIEPLDPAASIDPEMLGNLRRDLAHVHDIVDALRRFARPPAANPIRCDTNRAVRQMLDEYHWERWFEHVTIETELAEDLPPTFVDPVQLRRALDIVLLNACESVSNHSGTVVICTVANIDSPRPHVRIDVTDSGPGVPPEDTVRIFEPLYTTKAGHFGVGLPVAYTLLRQSGCSVAVSNSPKTGGATFTIRCPLWATPIEPGE